MIDYAIGILWALGTLNNDGKGTMRIVVRHEDKAILDDIALYGYLCIEPFAAKSQGRNVWRLNIPMSTMLATRLITLGWEPKSNPDRTCPIGEYDALTWLQGYCRMRAHLRWVKRNKKIVQMMIIYGAEAIVTNISLQLNWLFGTGVKKPQRIKGKTGGKWEGECWSIHYQGRDEVALLKNHLCADPAR